jgi:hypothetical protein
MSEPEEYEGDGPAVLPEREAMWILSQASEPEEDDEHDDDSDQGEA